MGPYVKRGKKNKGLSGYGMVVSTLPPQLGSLFVTWKGGHQDI